MGDSLTNWRQYWPYEVAKLVQESLMDNFAAIWNQYDIFVISAAPATGKTPISKCIMDCLYSVAYMCPTNQLLKQLLEAHPDTNSLHKLDSYYCDTWLRASVVTKAKTGSFCKRELNCRGCEQVKSDISNAMYKQTPIATNYHIFEAHKLQRDVLILDEGHNLESIIKSFLGPTLWQHDYGYPSDAYSPAELLEWIEKLPAKQKKRKRVQLLREQLAAIKPEFVVEITEDWFNGAGTKRGEPELRKCLKLLPVDISNAKQFFWNRGASKLVLLSATVSRKDVEVLGLHRFSKRICYLECASPIPPERRPVIPLPVVSLSKYNLEQSMPKLAAEIENIANQHAGERGVIHATYQMARLLEKYLTGPRYMFHTRDSKQSVYAAFLKDTKPRILVASGMYEGIDLPGDLGRWQIISKIPWPNLGNPAVKYMCDSDPELYTWLTLRTVIQACGRVCRTEADYGVTIVLDGTWGRLIADAERLNLVPQWFRECIVSA